MFTVGLKAVDGNDVEQEGVTTQQSRDLCTVVWTEYNRMAEEQLKCKAEELKQANS